MRIITNSLSTSFTLLLIVIASTGCVQTRTSPPAVALDALGLRQPSERLDYIVQNVPLKEYEVVASTHYLAFLKTANSPLDFDSTPNVNVGFDLGGIRFSFSPKLSAPAPPYWADEIVIVSMADRSLRDIVRVPVGSQMTFPLWSPNGRLLAFVLRLGDQLHIGVYSLDSRELHVLGNGDLSLWIKGQSTERGLQKGDVSAPFHWSKDSMHIVYARRVHAKRTDVDFEKAVVLPITMQTNPMRELHKRVHGNKYENRTVLSAEWQRYLFESEIVKIGVEDRVEQSISARGPYEYLFPVGEIEEWFATVYADRGAEAIRVIRLRDNSEVMLDPSWEEEDASLLSFRLFTTQHAQNGVYVWSKHASNDGNTADCFFFVDLRKDSQHDGKCANVNSDVLRIWKRGSLFVLKETIAQSREVQMRVINAGTGQTIGKIVGNGRLKDESGLQCDDFQWWPTPTAPYAGELGSKDQSNILLSGACGRDVAIDLLGAQWLSRTDGGGSTTLFQKEREIDFTNALRLSEASILILREESGGAPNFCIYLVKNRDCHQLRLDGRALDLDRFTRREVSVRRQDGPILHGSLLFPDNESRQADGRFPTIVFAYPQQELLATEYVPGETWRRIVEFSLTHLDTGIAQWLPTALLELGFAVLVLPDWPYFGVYGNEEYGPYEDQLTRNVDAYLDALSTIESVDMSRLGIAGHSKGGNEALLAAGKDPRFAFVMAFAPGTNLTDNPSRHQYETRSYWEVRQHYLEMSPILKANELFQPVLIIHPMGDLNYLSPPQVTKSFHFTLRNLGGTARTVLLPKGSHSLTTREEKAHTLYEVERWLNTIMRELEFEVTNSSE